MSLFIKLIVGVGNPGEQYARTRHNTGVWFVSRFADQQGAIFKEEKKFFGRTAIAQYESREIRLLLPNTFMNESGKAVGALANFFKIPAKQILIVHDELDLPTGVIRFKQRGGLAGHNGLRDITRCLGGNQDFGRLRIGVGHPGVKAEVTGHVLGKVSTADESMIYQCIDEALRVLPLAVNGEWQQAMTDLNGFRVKEN
ncbi:MAG: aminoacyl-tRNA hydrolase [bacterium]|nr:aminoacyl-tRNA hydrolase [Gammaproteobacteria bacterium]HIL95464.1 aminoacyl-tRNA hydrolase [Pseudomonadales bacterium]